MTASGTAGHGAEFAVVLRSRDLGAHVVKSLAAFEWEGNPAPRVHPAGAGMINAVGLQGPGVAAWLADDLPALPRPGRASSPASGAVRSTTTAAAAELLAAAPRERRRRRGQPVVPQPGGTARRSSPTTPSCRPR